MRKFKVGLGPAYDARITWAVLQRTVRRGDGVAREQPVIALEEVADGVESFLRETEAAANSVTVGSVPPQVAFPQVKV